MELEFSNQAATPDEKQQTGWYDLPYEMRIMIIEMMDTKTRGKLSSCSKLCCKEVRRSKNYIDFIRVGDDHSFDTDTAVYLIIGSQSYSSMMTFSKIKYTGKEEQCGISFGRSYERRYRAHDKTVDGSMEDVVLEYFNRFVNDAIHLETVWIESYWFNFDKTSIRHLAKLEMVRIKRNKSVDLSECGFLSIDQLVPASKSVHIESTNIEIDTLINFKAPEITIRYVSISPTQMKQYFEAWNNNQIHENVKKLEIAFMDDLYKVADDIVSGLNVVAKEKKRKRREKWFFIENRAKKVASIRITGQTIFVNFDGLYDGTDSSEEEIDDSSDEYYDSDD